MSDSSKNRYFFEDSNLDTDPISGERPVKLKFHADGQPVEMAITLTDNKGRFRFENVPEGKYRLMAQKWIGPYKGAFEVHGTVIQLLGFADDVVVPRPSKIYESQVVLTSLGNGIVQFWGYAKPDSAGVLPPGPVGCNVAALDAVALGPCDPGAGLTIF